MKARVEFTDSSGAATCQSDWPFPADRFGNWTPQTRPIGDSAHRQSDERLFMFRTSTRYGATFEVRGLGMGSGSFSSALNIADRLVAHLLNGGLCAVYTEDASGAAYLECGLMPATQPSLQMSDSRSIEFTLSLALINLATVPVQMVAHYAAPTAFAYLMDHPTDANTFVAGYGNKGAEASAFLKDAGSGVFTLDDSAAEEDRVLYLLDTNRVG